MSRHGACSEIAILARKVTDMEGIDDPTSFLGVMRKRGYDVTAFANQSHFVGLKYVGTFQK